MNCDLEKIVSLLQRSNPQYSENDMFSFFQRNQCVELFLLLANTPERQEKIKKQYLINAKKTMAHWEACSSFFELLNDCQISYATLKGAVLSKMIYNNEIFSMYDGEECEVELLCENELMKHIIDRFGEKVQTKEKDNKHFSAIAAVSLSPTFYGWVFSFGGKMKLISPTRAVNGFENMLNRF